jgi:hypothetical protein
MESLARYTGLVTGALIIGVLLSTLAKWLLKNTKLSSLNKNLIASLLSPGLSLLIYPSATLVYLAVAIPIFFIHLQADNKNGVKN